MQLFIHRYETEEEFKMEYASYEERWEAFMHQRKNGSVEERQGAEDIEKIM